MPGEATVVTGYYRYTDIWFEWYLALNCTVVGLWTNQPLARHQSLPEFEDRGPLKAILGLEHRLL